MSIVRKIGYAALRAAAVPLGMVMNHGLRILAYHDVPDVALFRDHVEYVARHYTPVAGPGQSEAGQAPPVWITFDDGDPSIMEVGLLVLNEFGIKATAFVCPGHVDTEEPFWWQVVEEAAVAGVAVGSSPLPSDEVARLKRMPDQYRRERVDEIRAALESRNGEIVGVRQLTTKDLRRWVDQGHTLGNHTWDHPILSNCAPEEQARQVMVAHEWLEERGMATDFFAYPNGDRADAAEKALAEARYTVGLLFDHEIAKLPPNLAMSRIRVNGTDPMNEFIAKVSGVHPALRSRVGP